jgi:hypothetical protein
LFVRGLEAEKVLFECFDAGIIKSIDEGTDPHAAIEDTTPLTYQIGERLQTKYGWKFVWINTKQRDIKRRQKRQKKRKSVFSTFAFLSIC